MFGNRPSLFNNANTSFGAGGTPFGSTGGTFGSQPVGTGLFGATNNSTTGTGLFGGGTSMFGQPAQQPQQSAFTFGAAPATATCTAQPATGSSLFGAPSTGFGAAQQTSLFGSGANPAGTFGVAATPAAGGLFGGATSGGFLTSGTATGSGTTVKFVPVTGSDVVMKGGSQQSVTTKLQCITGMKEYESKSLEELRVEDYLANRKGPQQQPQQSALGFGFGATAVQTTQSGFSGFGASKPATGTFGFGATSTGTSLFGSTQPQQQSVGSSLFGGSAFGAAKPLFGTATTSAASTPFGGLATASGGSSLFGAANKSLFGTTATTQATNLFGTAQPTATPAFGGFGATATSAFGTTATTTSGSLFGAKPTGFGQPATGLFGQPTSAANTGFQFGQQQPQQQQGALTGGLFGAKPATSTGFGGFGATATGSFGGFGTSQPGSGFGTTGLGTNPLFGQNQNKPATGGPSLFGGTGGFGTPGFGGFGTAATSQPAAGGLQGFGTTNTACQPAVDPTAVAIAQQNLQQLQQLTSSPYGDSPLFRNLRQDVTKRDDLLKPTSSAAQKAALANETQFKVGSRPSLKLKPKPLHSLAAGGKGQLFDGLEEDESSFDADTFVPRRSVRKLVLKSGKHNGSMYSHSPPSFLSGDDAIERDRLSNERPLSGLGDLSTQTNEVGRDAGPNHIPNLDDTIGQLNGHNRLSANFTEHDSGRVDPDIDFSNGPLTRQPFATQNESSSDPDDQTSSMSESDQPAHPAGIILHRHGYFTIPALEQLLPDEQGRCLVENFVIGREGYGNVMFSGITDVAGMNLDEIVHFRRKEIDIYPNDDLKPAVGEGLNKKAQVTLDYVYPRDKTNGSLIKDFNRLKELHYMEFLEKATTKIGAKFIDYRTDTGSWVFEVKHFSKYGLPDDSDDEDLVGIVPNQLKMPPTDRALIPPLQQQQQANIETKVLMADVGVMAEERRHVGLGGHIMMSSIVDEEDSEMPDITREKFPETAGILVDDDVEDDGMDVVPASHSIARRLQVTASQIQIQKASFFADENDEEYSAATCGDYSKFGAAAYATRTKKPVMAGSPWAQSALFKQGLFSGYGDSPAQHGHDKLVQPTLDTPKTKATQFVTTEHILIPSGMDKLMHRPVVGTRVQRSVVPLERSLLLSKRPMVMDAGIVQSRRFRVGWASSWIMTYLTNGAQSTSDHNDMSMSANYSLLMDSRSVLTAKKALCPSDYRVTIESITQTPSSDISVIKNVLENRLMVELENSEREVEYGCPVFTPSAGNDLLQGYVKQSANEQSSLGSVEASVVWQLCDALWGQLDDTDVSDTSYVSQHARREALSYWLTQTTADAVVDEIQQATAKGRDNAAGIFSCLTARLIEEALERAISSSNLRLAQLITQALGYDDTRQLLLSQLAAWADLQMDQYIDDDILRICTLLSGNLMWNCSNRQINTCASLDWKRCFALHLWYQCSPTAVIADAMEAYDRSYGNGEMIYAAAPLPHYLEKLGVEQDCGVQDVCYHLLKLFCDRTQPLHVLLNPITMTSNDLDYSLSWHLMETLLSLGYTQLSDDHHAYICISYASQLESLGLWHWAVFVLLHLRDPLSRSYVIQQTLEHHVPISVSEGTDEEEFLLNSLHIPVTWIHSAKAVRARYEGKHVAEAWHLLKAEQWNMAHSLVMKNIASEAIINGEQESLCTTYFELMSDPSLSAQIMDWSVGGRMCLDYCKMLQMLIKFRQGAIQNDYELEELHSLAVSIGTRVNKLKCEKAIDSVCQSEMSKNVAKVMTLLLATKERSSQQQQQYLSLTASHVTSLPLPEDYALEALGHVSHALLHSASMYS